MFKVLYMFYQKKNSIWLTARKKNLISSHFVMLYGLWISNSNWLAINCALIEVSIFNRSEKNSAAALRLREKYLKTKFWCSVFIFRCRYVIFLDFSPILFLLRVLQLLELKSCPCVLAAESERTDLPKAGHRSVIMLKA